MSLSTRYSLRGEAVVDNAAGAWSGLDAAAEHLALDPDDLRGPAGRPVPDGLHAVTALAQRPNDRVPETGLETEARVRPRCLATHRPARGIDRCLNRHAEVDQVADQLQVGLNLPE